MMHIANRAIWTSLGLAVGVGLGGCAAPSEDDADETTSMVEDQLHRQPGEQRGQQKNVGQPGEEQLAQPGEQQLGQPGEEQLGQVGQPPVGIPGQQFPEQGRATTEGEPADAQFLGWGGGWGGWGYPGMGWGGGMYGYPGMGWGMYGRGFGWGYPGFGWGGLW